MNPIEIVVCRYQEQPAWIKPWARILPVTIYDKGLQPLCDCGSANVFPAINVGRETQAWFMHLLAQRQADPDPPRHTIFLQADPTPHTGADVHEVIGRLIAAAGEDIAYFPISNFEILCDQDGEPHHPGLPMKRCWDAMFTDDDWKCPPCPEMFVGYAGGQFMVRNDLIEQYPTAFWAKGNELCSGSQNPAEAYVFERLWHAIWMNADSALTERTLQQGK